MAREIVLGNGNMLVCLDRNLNMRDFYYPVVGLNNHIAGHRNRLGIWVNGKFSWTEDDSWCHETGYKDRTMISQVKTINHSLGISLELTDSVYFGANYFLKKVVIMNLDCSEREVRLFFTHDFSINESAVGDTAFFDPVERFVCHYKRNRYLLINGTIAGNGIYQYAIGRKRIEGAEGTWRDAEDGVLEQMPIDHGSIDSVVSFRTILGAGETATVYYWIVAGKDIKEVRAGNEYILKAQPSELIEKTDAYWRNWAYNRERNFYDLCENAVDMFYRSLLVTRTQMDNGGAILASTDSDLRLLYPDHYSYVWPRDGALVAYALDMAGYTGLTQKFFEFSAKIITDDGYFMQKYNPDGTLGSSWHPWWKDGKVQLPIQEDETALVLWALGYHYEVTRDIEFIEALYSSLISKAADFLVSYRDTKNKLPLPSYDLWEERRGIFTFTCSAVYGALKASAYFAKILGHKTDERKYTRAAAEVHEGMERYLYCTNLNRFLRGVYIDEDGQLKQDLTLDSSLYGVFEFGAFSPNDPKVISTMQTVMKNLWVKTDIGGIARYADDYYCKKKL